MAVTSKTIRTARRTRRPSLSFWQHTYTAATGATLLLAAFALTTVLGTLTQWGQRAMDDLRYGRPRTTHLEGYVGHGEAAGQPSHFIAVNLNRQITVFELPGGDASQVRSISGPYLFGADEDLTPVQLSLRDIDGDGQRDLLVDIHQERIIYLNRDGGFRLPTADEQARLKLEPSP